MWLLLCRNGTDHERIGVAAMDFYGYTRASTKGQNVDRGIMEITEYCKTHNIPLKKIYVDFITGKTFDRKEFNKLKKELKQAMLSFLQRSIGLVVIEMKS